VVVAIGAGVGGRAVAAFVLAAPLALLVLVGGSVTQPKRAVTMRRARIAVIDFNKVFTCYESIRYDDEDRNARAGHRVFVQTDAQGVHEYEIKTQPY
jgi:hypothetical protein